MNNSHFSPRSLSHSVAIGHELHFAGIAIYNGLFRFDGVHAFNHPAITFEILYSFSIGLERLIKIGILYAEDPSARYDAHQIESLEQSLITHDVLGLHHRWVDRTGHNRQKFKGSVNAFLQMLSKFYKSQRYARFSLSHPYSGTEEHSSLISFISAHILQRKEAPSSNEVFLNNAEIRKKLGRIVERIVHPIMEQIYRCCDENDIFIYEFLFLPRGSWVYNQSKRALNFNRYNQLKLEVLYYFFHKNRDVSKSVPALSLEDLDFDSLLDFIVRDDHTMGIHSQIEEMIELDMEEGGPNWEMRMTSVLRCLRGY